MIVKGFWHCYLVNHWYSICIDQMRILLDSGLYDRSEEINIGCIGTPEERALLQKLFINQYSKLKVKYFSNIPERYEFPTLKLIEDDKSKYVGYYFHTKGVTRPNETIINHWRAWLNEAILNRWQEHCERVENGYDASSVNYLANPNHFSGNFWWFNRKHISKLPKVLSLDLDNRFHAEQYICMRKGKYFYNEFVEPGVDVFKIRTHE